MFLTVKEWWLVPALLLACGMMATLLVGAALVVRDTARGRGRWGMNFRSVLCPSCGEPAPFVRKPANRRQALWGGWTCRVCGCEYDKWGEALEPESSGSSGPQEENHV